MSKYEGAVDELQRAREYIVDMLKLTENHPTHDEINIAGAEPYYKGIRQGYNGVLRYIDDRLAVWED